jgi:L-asparaginase
METIEPIVIKARNPTSPTQKCVAVINTGGTIGMKANETGSLEPCPGYLAERMRAMHEFRRAEMPATTMYELLPLLDSSDMGPDDWVRMAKLIESLYFDYDGFVIIMGTDTMAYAASALSFMVRAPPQHQPRPQAA